MPPRRSIKKKGRVQKLEAASESILLKANEALSPTGSVSDDDAIDDIEADKENSHGNKRPAGDGLSQHEMQTEYVEKIIEEVERKGAALQGIERTGTDYCLPATAVEDTYRNGPSL